MENLPTTSILLKPENKSRNSDWFKSQIYNNLQKNNNAKEDNEQDDKLIKELEDILICCICREYLDNPVNDPTCCPHYACKSCFDKCFQKKKSNLIPCPICRKYIKKRNLVKIPIAESIKGILKDVKNNRMENNNLKVDEKCVAHPNNKVFYICLDCQIKMCPICNEEKKKHENHHQANYERYVKLFNFIQTSFTGIKQNIAEREENIKEYKDLYILLEQQKNAYLECLNDMSLKIQKIYKKNQENINKVIGESMEKIAQYRNFMSNIKSHISSKFKKNYEDIDNLEEIKEEIKKRVDKLGLKEINKNEIKNIKNKSLKNLNLILQKQFSIMFNKNDFLANGHVKTPVDKDKNYEFGLELSEDGKMINAYLDIKKIINNQVNDSSYVVFIEYGPNKKRLYFEPVEVDNEHYSFEKSLPTKEFSEAKETNIEIILKFLSINIK